MAAQIRILRFWTTYRARAGETIPVDMVEYCAPGMAQRMTTTSPVSMLSAVRKDGDADNPAWQQARDRWDAIRPAYEAWKQGQELPNNGTALAAWSGITPEQADILRASGVRSVEEIAEASDGVLSRIQLPGIRDLAAQARLFLASRDSVKVAADLLDKDKQLAELREQLEEMRQLVLAREPELEADGSERRRGPGRPRKIEAEVA